MGQAISLLMLLLLVSLTKEIECRVKRQVSGDKVPFRKQAYRFGYNVKDQRHGNQYRQEEGDHRGIVQGSYGYQDPYGIYRQVEYIADALGFRARVRSNEPGLGHQNPANVEIIKTGHPQSISLHHNTGPIASNHLVAIHPASSNQNTVKVKDTLKPAESSQVIKPEGRYESNKQQSGVIRIPDKTQNSGKNKPTINVLFSNKPTQSKKKKKKQKFTHNQSDIQRIPQVGLSKAVEKPVKHEVIIEYPQNPAQNPQNTAEYPQNPSTYPQKVSEYSQNPSEYPQKVSEYPQNPSDYPQKVSEYPQNPSEYPQKGLEYSQNPSGYPQKVLEYSQNPAEYIQSPQSPGSSEAIVEVDRPVPLPYFVQSPYKRPQPAIDVIHHPSVPQNKYQGEDYQYSYDPNYTNQQDAIIMVEPPSDIHTQPSINRPHQLQTKQVAAYESKYESKDVPLVIVKPPKGRPKPEFTSSSQQGNKVPFVIMKEGAAQDQRVESTNNNVRPVATFLFDRDFKTSQTLQKIQCPIACFTPSFINGDKERRYYQPIPCFAIQQY